MDSLDQVLDVSSRLIDNYKLEEPNQILTEAIEQYPGNADLYDLSAISHFRRMKIEEALQDWNTAISIDEDFHLGYFHLAEFYIQSNDFGKAEQQIKKAIAIEPAAKFA